MNTWTIFMCVVLTIVGLLCLVGIGWLFHRLCVKLEESGYLYYRKSNDSGGGGGALYELDRLTRPSIEHVIEVNDEIKQEEEIDGD